MSYAQILRTNDKIEKKEGQEGKTPVANKGTQTKYDGRSSKPANSYSSFSSPRSKHGKNQSKSKDERPQVCFIIILFSSLIYFILSFCFYFFI